VGGLAVGILAKPRATEGIDLLVKPQNLIRIKKLSNRPRDWIDIQAIEESITEI